MTPSPETPERKKMFDLSIALQARFDALATEYDRGTRHNVTRRQVMLAMLAGNDQRFTEHLSLSENAEPADAGRLNELWATNLDTLERFDRMAEEYVQEIYTKRAQRAQMVCTLQDIEETRRAFAANGCAMPDLIEHIELARRLTPARPAPVTPPAL